MKNKNSAFTLVEVLVATVIGVISILALFSSYNYFNKSYKSVSQKSAINSSAREALTVIARDLRNAGYIDINYTKDSRPETHLINLRNKFKSITGNMDSIGMMYTVTPTTRQRVYYTPKKYQNSNDFYLAREVVNNPIQGPVQIIYDNVEFIPYISDFQVVYKDKDGNELVPVCYDCGPVEQAQGSSTKVGSYNLGEANMQKVHTAEVYLTVRSSKEIYKNNKSTIIKNHSGSNGNTQTFNDKYHRETFFISVHTRNLATPQVIAEKTGESIGTGTSYNK